jgi:hypothetical protein
MNKNKIVRILIIILFLIILIGINCKCFAESFNIPFLLDTQNTENIDNNKMWEEKGNELKQTYENIENKVNNKLFSDSNKVAIIFVIVIVSVIALIIIGIVLNSVIGKRNYKKYLVHYNEGENNDRIDISRTGTFEESNEEIKKEEYENNQTENNENNNINNSENKL